MRPTRVRERRINCRAFGVDCRSDDYTALGIVILNGARYPPSTEKQAACIAWSS